MEQFSEKCSVIKLQIDIFTIYYLFLIVFFRRMRDEVDLVDVTFACDGKKIGAHKLVLYSCSPYFKDLLKDNPANSHPIFYMNNVKFDVLKAILEYMYLGEVHITNENLKDFIKTAEALQIRGLSKENSNVRIYSENFVLFLKFCLFLF